MKSSKTWSAAQRALGAAALAALAATFAATSARAAPDPCKLVTVAELQQIVGPLSGVPTATDPASGEVTCTHRSTKGPSFIDVSLHDGDLAAWRRRNGGETPVALPEFGAGAFVNPDFHDMADLYAKRGNLILRVTMPKSPQAVDMVKLIARKALARM